MRIVDFVPGTDGTVTAGGSSLRYRDGLYTYIWKRRSPGRTAVVSSS